MRRSLHPRLQRHSTRIVTRLSKTNPYVGSFRHSPPSSARSLLLMDNPDLARQPVLIDRTHSPYTGTFRHSPPSSFLLSTTTMTALQKNSSSSSTRALRETTRVAWGRTGVSFVIDEQIKRRNYSSVLYRHGCCNKNSDDTDHRHQDDEDDDDATILKNDIFKSDPFHYFHPHPLSNKRFHVYIDGHLKGGAPDNSNNNNNNYHRSLSQSLLQVETNSATVQVLTRFASWLLQPAETRVYDSKRVALMYPPQRTESDDDDDDSQDDDEHDENSCYSNDDSSSDYSVSTVGTHLPQDASTSSRTSPPTDQFMTVSSLAEAYYAHQAAVEAQQEYHDQQESPWTEASSMMATGGISTSELMLPSALASSTATNTTSHDDDPNRLDYVITQVDIARMARNASRHLDVESILNLPTTTYRADSNSISSKESLDGQIVVGGNDDDDDDEVQNEAGWSWTIVPPAEDKTDTAQSGRTGPQKKDQSHACVICLEEFQEGDRLRVLPCDHSFHVGCIDRWLSGSSSFEECYTNGCPTCKKRPTVPDSLDGSVPSWAFARIGRALATSQQEA